MVIGEHKYPIDNFLILSTSLSDTLETSWFSHSDLNDQNLFHSAIDTPTGGLKNSRKFSNYEFDSLENGRK